MKSELSPVEKRLVWDEAKEAELQKLRHMKAAADACKGISTEALEAGVVEDMKELLHVLLEGHKGFQFAAAGNPFAIDPFLYRMKAALALLETKEKSDG